MPRHVALLRAVNVTDRFVKMPQLLAACAAIGATGARSVIASGNLIFDHRARTETTLAARLEAALLDTLGFDVAVFLRGADELRARASAAPLFAEPDAGQTVHVLFLRHPPDAAQQATLAALQSADDEIAVQGREVFWRARRPQTQSTFSAALLERRLGVPTTLRTWATLQRIAAALDA